MTCVHKTVRVKVWADVDELICPLVEKLNSFDGVTTHASCQGTIGGRGAEPYGAYVMSSWRKDMEPFMLRNFNIEFLGECWGKVSERSPASTARTDVTPDSIAKWLRLQEQENHPWDSREKREIFRLLMAFAMDHLAAPGSVPQAQGCSCEPGNHANATECHNLGAKSCVGVPQAEPPKEEKP